MKKIIQYRITTEDLEGADVGKTRHWFKTVQSTAEIPDNINGLMKAPELPGNPLLKITQIQAQVFAN